jgi:hypothetical protein
MESAQSIVKHLRSITSYQNTRQENLMRAFFMYQHSTIRSDADVYGDYFGEMGPKINLIQSGVDTLLNKIIKNQPRPMFLTDGGDWGLQQKAKKRNAFVQGAFYATKTYQKSPHALLNALVYGDGFIKVYSDNDSIIVDPALTLEIFVDENESLYGKPRRMWQIRLVDKDTLKAMYPEAKDKIEKAQTVTPPFYMNTPAESKLVGVVEYWKLPRKQNGKYVGGEHRIIVGDEDLVKGREWKRPNFPFAKLGFTRNLVGWWSKGIAEVGTPYQIEVNKTLKRISDSLRLVASPKVLYDYQSKIVQSHFNNDVGAMIGYLGTPPTFINPSAVSPEMFKHLADMIQMFYNEIGVSTLSATSQKPAGLNSGKALREYNDIETERFSSFAKNWEQFHIDIAELVLQEAAELAERNKNVSFLAADSKGCETISFKDINMEEDKYVIQVYPTSMLPKTPAGRLEYVQEMLGAGLLSPEEGLSLLEFPDVEKVARFKNAAFDDILATIDHMLEKDEYLPPEPYQKLEVGVQYMQSAYLYYKNRGCPQEKLDLLLNWINDATEMLSPPEEVVNSADQMPMPAEEMPEELPPELMAEMPQEPVI